MINCNMNNKIVLPKINKEFTRDDLREYIKQFVKEDTYSPMYMAVCYYVYTLRIPAIVTGREINVKGKYDESKKEDPFFPITTEDKFILEKLKFGFRASHKLNINEIVDVFLKSFDKILKQGYTETILESEDEDNSEPPLIQRTYIKKFIPIEI